MSLDISTLPIKLVEPSAVQAKVITDMLAKHGAGEILRFDSAAALLAEPRPDKRCLVISALYLPDMTGTELVQRMRASQAFQDTPFILISSETRPQVLEPVRQAGVCGLLPKPFSDKQLDIALRATLDYLDDSAELETGGLDLAAIRVLLVDDSVSARRFMRRTLENLGITRFVEAGDGREAIPIISETPFDLIITDYNMPDLDGKGLIEHIRNQSWQASVPILMVTSESSAQRLAGVEEAGVSGICDKPFEPAVVRQLLERILVHDS